MPDRFESEPYALPRRRPEPFFTEAEPCESCGRPALNGRTFDPEHGIWIANGCPCLQEEQPICRALEQPILKARTVREVREVIRNHRALCPICGTPARKEATSQSRKTAERKAA